MFVRKRILVVEEKEMDRQFLRHILTNASYTIETVKSSERAMEILENENFDTFIIDIHMPNLEGVKLIKELREDERFKMTPILALTSANVEALRQKGEKLGITEWIKRPISPPNLLNLLRKMNVTNHHQVQTLF